MKNLNKTIYKFNKKGSHFEIDWLTDATYNKGEMVCDIFMGRGKSAECVGQIIIKEKTPKLTIRKMAMEEIENNLNIDK